MNYREAFGLRLAYRIKTVVLGNPNCRPGACIKKLITAVIYGFRNKLECLSVVNLSSLV